jgi:hypothetical protein
MSAPASSPYRIRIAFIAMVNCHGYHSITEECVSLASSDPVRILAALATLDLIHVYCTLFGDIIYATKKYDTQQYC